MELLEEQLDRRVAGFIRRVGAAAALTGASEWLRDDDTATRTLGWETLGLLALDETDAADVMLTAAPAATHDPEPTVRRALARALGNQSDRDVATDLLLGMIDDADEDTRVQAIAGLGITLTDPPADHPVVVALVGLLRDPNPAIRDLTAFVLGQQFTVDTPELRAALLTMANDDIDEPGAYPAAEAAAGLVNRGDPRVIDVVIARLQGVEVGSLWLELAAELADSRLMPALTGLRARFPDDGDDWDEDLSAAMLACAAPATSRDPSA